MSDPTQSTPQHRRCSRCGRVALSRNIRFICGDCKSAIRTEKSGRPDYTGRHSLGPGRWVNVPGSGGVKVFVPDTVDERPSDALDPNRCGTQKAVKAHRAAGEQCLECKRIAAEKRRAAVKRKTAREVAAAELARSTEAA